MKKIFDIAINGSGSKLIAKYLNDNQYLSPSGYRKTGVVKDENNKYNQYKWNEVTVCAMLDNEVYIGNTVQNKKTIVSYKVKKVRKVDEGSQIRVENTHEAIIDKSIYDKVQTLRRKRAKICAKQYDYLLKGLLFCPHCHRQLQIVLKVNHSANRRKIPYIVDTDSKRRKCYNRNLNYPKFEKKIIEIVRKVCQIYVNRKLLEESYQRVNNKAIDITKTIAKEIEVLKAQENTINDRLDKIYDDKLNGILPEIDFIRISERFIKERKNIEEKMRNLTNQLQNLKGQKRIQDKKDESKLNELINEFLQLKEISKSYLFRLIDKIEIDKDKKVFISFNFAPLNTICDNMDEFIEIEKILQEDTKTLKQNVG